MRRAFKQSSSTKPRLPVGMVLLALAAGLLLRLLFLWRFAHIQGDSLVYGEIATNLLQHGIYGLTNGPDKVLPVRPTLIRLPGYPLLLALIFKIFGIGKYYAVMGIQIALDLAGCLLLSTLALRLFGRRAGLAALWLSALCPFTANYTVAPLTETPVLFTISAAYFLLERWRRRDRLLNLDLVGLGLVLAASALLRPDQGLLAAAIVPAVLYVGWTRNRGLKALQPALVVAVLTVLPLVPWTARNWHTFHVFQPFAPRTADDPGERNPDGFQRWYRTWAIDYASTDAVYWNFDSDTIDIATLPNRAFDSQQQYSQTSALLDDYNERTIFTLPLDARFNAIAVERIHADPLRYYVALPTARLLNMCFRPRTAMLATPTEWWKFQRRPRACLFALLWAGLNLAYFVLAGWTVFHPGRWQGQRVLVWSMLAYVVMRSALLLTLDNSEPRYTLEFFPILIVLGACCWQTTFSFRSAAAQ